MLLIHPMASISPLADIEDSVRGTRIVIGAGTMVDSFVKIKPAGGSGDLVIGEACAINSGCVFYTGNGLSMGNHVAVAANCTFAPVNHAFSDASQLISGQGFLPSKCGIIVGNDVWIGANCVFLDGAIVEDGVVVGAGSVVRSTLEAYGVYAGSPPRLIGNRLGRRIYS